MKDEDRALTPEGVKKMKKTAQGLVDVVGKKGISCVLASPALRARQTAAILVEAMEDANVKVELQVSAALWTGGSLQGLIKDVRAARRRGGEDVAVVGHEPVLSAWIGELCFGRAGRVLMKKGAVAAIELAENGTAGELVWLMQPGMLREL